MQTLTEELEQYRRTCAQALVGHGNRKAKDFLGELPPDAAVDRYGMGGVVEALENEVRGILRKPAAVFMPTGTMAQQIALRIQADRRGVRSFACHPTCHLLLHEDRAFEHLHGLTAVPVGDSRRLITLQDVRAIRAPLAAMLFELPQREIGGRLPEWNDLQSQIAALHERGVPLHLDGARLWECTPFYGLSAGEIAAGFDTVYVSFYKGLGAVAGAILAGDEDSIAVARDWRKRHGGTVFGLWPYAASCLSALQKRLPRMPRYLEHARALAVALRAVPELRVVPDPPQTPMMHLHLQVEEREFLAAARQLARTQSLFTWSRTVAGETPDRRVVELVVGDATLEFTPDDVAAILAQLVRPTGG